MQNVPNKNAPVTIPSTEQTRCRHEATSKRDTEILGTSKKELELVSFRLKIVETFLIPMLLILGINYLRIFLHLDSVPFGRNFFIFYLSKYYPAIVS